MIRIQPYFPEDLYNQIKQFAKEEKTSFSAIVREGLEIIIKKKKRELIKRGLLVA